MPDVRGTLRRGRAVVNRRLRVRGRTSPSARVLVLAAMGVAMLALAALALAPALGGTRAARHSSGTATGRPATERPGLRHAEAVPPRQLARARSATRQFMEGYLRFAYGEAPASSVRAVGTSLRRALRHRALLAPAERGRHPRVISLGASGEKRGVVVATAIIDDGGIASYAIRVAVRKTRSGWLVSAVDGG